MDPPSSCNHKTDLDNGDPSSTLLDRMSCQLHDLDSVELPPELTNPKLQLYWFESTLSVLNNGLDELKSWKNGARSVEDGEEVVSPSDREVLLSNDAGLPHEQEGSGGSGERALDWGPGGGPNHIASRRFGFGVNFNSYERMMHEFLILHDFFTAYDEVYDSFGTISTFFFGGVDIGQAIAKDMFDDRVTGKLKVFDSRAKIVHIDIDYAEIWKNEQPQVSICVDLKLALQSINEILECMQKLIFPLSYKTFEDGISPQYAIQVLDESTNGSAIVGT
ncbi:DHS-like NAD/FAD-binding domain superfamily [Sesbania bispinosa]|nr:DHS-like NAD/FAD-binding domain superfamily [Sesbania bispinosa]